MPILAPIAHFSGSGWLTTLIVLAALLPLTLLPKSWSGLPRPVALLQILWLGVLTAQFLPDSALYWPSDNEFVVPLVILALAALTTPKAAPRVTKALTLCTSVLVIPLLIAGESKATLSWLRPLWTGWPWGLVTALLLANLPTVNKKRSLVPIVLGISILIQGSMTAAESAELPDALYQTARTLGRMEPIAAAAMTLLWYTMTVAVQQSAVQIAGENELEEKTAYVLHAGTAAILILSRWQLQQHKTAVLSVIFLVLIPFLRKMKKVKNGA